MIIHYCHYIDKGLGVGGGGKYVMNECLGLGHHTLESYHNAETTCLVYLLSLKDIPRLHPESDILPHLKISPEFITSTDLKEVIES